MLLNTCWIRDTMIQLHRKGTWSYICLVLNGRLHHVNELWNSNKYRKFYKLMQNNQILFLKMNTVKIIIVC